MPSHPDRYRTYFQFGPVGLFLPTHPKDPEPQLVRVTVEDGEGGYIASNIKVEDMQTLFPDSPPFDHTKEWIQLQRNKVHPHFIFYVLKVIRRNEGYKTPMYKQVENLFLEFVAEAGQRKQRTLVELLELHDRVTFLRERLQLLPFNVQVQLALQNAQERERELRKQSKTDQAILDLLALV
jgi:hypothetical protein